ncbi:MAG: hypothetical protein JW802_10110 [Campylobacterales bacterium]|nr:hypothetical protein [Campylobacterales bacterium]MBN2832436.1 hypothetical protein [Campylobacterales bacterium]
METFVSIFAIVILLSFLWLLIQPRKQPKSKEQKQEEICQMYRQRLNTELEHIQNSDERQSKKIALLQEFAKELEFNLFFDKEEVKVLIQELAGY